MTTDGGGRVPLAQYWGVIQRAVSERVTTAELWNMIRNASEAEGYVGTTGGLPEMNRLRGAAAAIRNASDVFRSARDDATITASMFAPDINAKAIPGLSLTPVYRVRFEHTIGTLEGQLVTTWRTISFPMQLPGTKDLLMAELEANASSLAEQYGEEHIGLDGVEITVV